MMGCGSSRDPFPHSPFKKTPVYQIEGGGTLSVNSNNTLKNVISSNNKAAKDSTTTQIDVIQWNRLNISDDPEGLEQEPEIVSLHRPTYAKSLEDALKRSSECQTDPVNEEVFDWDLSDRTDTETQTNPPTRATSTNNQGSDGDPDLQDAIVQTDQRLTFLLHKSEEERIKWLKKGHAPPSAGGVAPQGPLKITFADASVQTYIEVTTVAIQVDPIELSEFSGTRIQESRNGAKIPFNFDEASDFSDADISTVHVNSNTPSRKSGAAKSGKRRLIRNRDGTYLGSPDEHSDPDEIIYASEANIVSPVLSPIPTQSDAGFQTNMIMATVAASNTNNSMSTPVGLVQPGDRVGFTSKNGALLKRVNPKYKSDVGVQTDEELSEEAGGYRAEPSQMRKYELIGSDPDVFKSIDQWVLDISSKRYKHLKKILALLAQHIEDEPAYNGIEDLIRIRAFYRWTTENISYDQECFERDMTTKDILREKVGVCREYVKIFSEFCELAGFRVKGIRGYTKGPNFVPGTLFGTEDDGPPHAWNAVYFNGGWRLVDCTWGAGQFNPTTQNFEKKLNEHFFLTDPQELIFTHFPYDEAESNYEKWQLLRDPVDLDTFNTMPVLTSFFFEYCLKFPQEVFMPLETTEFVDVKIKAYEVTRYKFKFFSLAKKESDALCQYVLCYLKGKNRRQVIFHVTPPEPGDYLLKVYAKPEIDIQNESDTLDHVATIHIKATQVKSKPLPLPRCDLPWGLTQNWYDTEAIVVGTTGRPVIPMIGEKKAILVLLTPKAPLLSLCHIYDCEGNELVQDKGGDIKYTVLLNRKNFFPSNTSEEEGETSENSLLPFITKKTTPTKTVFTIENPPKEGFFKLQIYARKKPTKKGRLKIPLVANFLIEYHHQAQPVNQKVGVRKSISAAAIGEPIKSNSAKLESTSRIPSSNTSNIIERRKSLEIEPVLHESSSS